MGIDLPSLDRLRAQEHDAFGVLVTRHYGAVHHYLIRLTGDSEIAVELTQETFLRAYQALPKLADDSNVGGWLFRIATNLARQHHRRPPVVCWSRLSRSTRVEGLQRVGYTIDLDGVAAGFEDDVAGQDLVRRALHQVPLEQRVCLLLYAWTGYTCAEIGEIVGKSTDAVRMMLVRARRRFRAAYGDAMGHGHGDLRGEGNDSSAGESLGGGRGAGPQSVTGSGRGRIGAVGDMDDEHDRSSGCDDVHEVLPFYQRGDLPREDFSAVTQHLTRCRLCRHALAELHAENRILQRYLNVAGEGHTHGTPAMVMVAVARLRAPLPAMQEALVLRLPPHTPSS